MTEKFSQAESDAYLDGWGVAHRDGERCNMAASISSLELFAWYKGYDDCKRGAINAPMALGPYLLTGEE